MTVTSNHVDPGSIIGGLLVRTAESSEEILSGETVRGDVEGPCSSGYDLPRVLGSLDTVALTARGMVGCPKTLRLMLSVVAGLEAL